MLIVCHRAVNNRKSVFGYTRRKPFGGLIGQRFDSARLHILIMNNRFFRKYTGSKPLLYSLIALLVIMLAIIYFNDSSKVKKETYTLYIGGYGNSAYKYAFNTKSGEFVKQEEYKTVNPSFLAISPDSKFLYAVNENGTNSGVSSFKVAGGTPLSQIKSKGEGPCYITLYKSHLFTANYDNGSISVFKTDTSGKITRALQLIQFVNSADENKRNISRIHTVRIITGKQSKNDYLLAADKGADHVYMFHLQLDSLYTPQAGETPDLKLTKCDSSDVSIPNGYGPRHLEFSKNGRYMYLINEVSGNVMSFTINEKNNHLAINVQQDTTAAIYGGEASADIHISPDGEYLYTSHRRGKDGISIFKIAEDGTLNHIGYQVTSSYPRGFAITPDGEYMFVACQKDKCVQVFKINKKTGFLSNTKKALTFSDLEPSVVLAK